MSRIALLLSLAALAIPGAASAHGPSRDDLKELEHAVGMVLAIFDVGTGGDDARADAIAAAESAVGSPYVPAGTTRAGFDCSGLTRWAFRHAGIGLPHSSYDQFAMGQAIDRGDVEAGDLVFFDTAGSGASHVGIAIGPREAISATSSGGVMEHTIRSGYWGDHLLGARRLGAEPTSQ